VSFFLPNEALVLIAAAYIRKISYENRKIFLKTSGLYYNHVTIIIYDRNDSVQYHKTTITIVIDDP
jgi:hypothetical protein